MIPGVTQRVNGDTQGRLSPCHPSPLSSVAACAPDVMVFVGLALLPPPAAPTVSPAPGLGDVEVWS